MFTYVQSFRFRTDFSEKDFSLKNPYKKRKIRTRGNVVELRVKIFNCTDFLNSEVKTLYCLHTPLASTLRKRKTHVA